MEEDYDTHPYSKHENVKGFRNALEGFAMLRGTDKHIDVFDDPDVDFNNGKPIIQVRT